ncbi:hypothetical protein CK203_107406 [Vitis vinifera]|uniref:DUF4216 domain-containing protein n=1 Tax=Vitis vinifera TaxID=29760 RepID=A0A438CTK5_VITVI|nr:hypothetical protein CK203_107406 [Vitis vinifera]
MLCQTPQVIREHLFFNGIDLSYRVWYWHGEKGPSEAFSNVHNNVMTNEYNDVADTIDMVNAAQVNCMNDPQVFGRLLEDAEKPLYPGCMKYTKLSALVKLYNLKARYGWSDKGFSELLQLLGDMLPLNNEMPLSMYEAKKTFSALVKVEDKQWGKIKKGVPAKVLWYFPPIPRFKRMFQSSETAKHLMWHAKDKEYDGPRQPGKNIDVYLSPLVDDLKTLWEKGVETYDAYLREVPEGYCSNFRNLVSLEELKLFGLKSHDYHALMQQLLPVALRSVLPKHVRLCGPVYFRWMYPFEREHMNWLKSQYPRQSKRQIWLQEEHMRCFTYWLKGKVEEAIHNRQDIPNTLRCDELGFTLVDFSKIGHKSDPFILASQAKQVFYVEDQLDPKWSIVLSIPPKDFNNMEGLDDFTDNCMEHHPFISSMPEVESFDVMDESEAIYMREDCEGIWIENN